MPSLCHAMTLDTPLLRGTHVVRVLNLLGGGVFSAFVPLLAKPCGCALSIRPSPCFTACMACSMFSFTHEEVI
eukprot:1183073-Prorocentrum_minimum.AAC.4